MNKTTITLITIISLICSCQNNNYDIFGVYDNESEIENNKFIPFATDMLGTLNENKINFYQFDESVNNWEILSTSFNNVNKYEKIISLGLNTKMYTFKDDIIEFYEVNDDGTFIKKASGKFELDGNQIVKIGLQYFGVVRDDFIDVYEFSEDFENIKIKDKPVSRFEIPDNTKGFINVGLYYLGVITNENNIVIYKYVIEDNIWEKVDVEPFFIPKNTDGLIAEWIRSKGYTIGVVKNRIIEFYIIDKSDKWMLVPEITLDLNKLFKVALFSDNYEIVKSHISLFKELDTINLNTFNPLMLSATKEDIKFMQLFLENGANPNTISDKNKFGYLSPLSISIVAEKKEYIDLLLKNDADINLINKNNKYPLDFANTINILEYLIDKGAKTNTEGYYRIGNLYYKENKHKKAFEYFLISANEGFAKAQNDVGYMYSQGKGVEKDKYKANEWYKKAKDNGSEQGAKNYNPNINHSSSNSPNSSSSTSKKKRNPCDNFSFEVLDRSKRFDYGGFYSTTVYVRANNGIERMLEYIEYESSGVTHYNYGGKEFGSLHNAVKYSVGC